jgi:phage FluMu protein Com
MASDSLLKVIAGLVRREGRIAKEDAKKAKEALKAEAEDDDEEDEDEDPVGKPPAEKEPEEEPEKEPEEEPEKEPEEDDGEGDTKPTGPDPTLVAQVAAIVKKEIEDEAKEKKEVEIKLSGKKEKIDTKPKMEQRMGRMNFREAIRRSVTGTHLSEGYEEVVLGILEDESIKGPLGYEPFFEKGKLFVMKGQERTAQKALKNSKDISKVPKIVGEEMEAEEYLAMEAVDVDGRCSGFKEALRRLTYEKIRQMKEKEKAKTEEVEVDESNELQAIMALGDENIEAEINKKGQVVVKKKDLKNAEKALKKSFKKGGIPKLVGEGADKDTKGDKEAYQKFFQATLKKFGVTEPDQLKGDKKKEFFDAIDKGWKADNEKPEPGDKKEEVEIDEKKGSGYDLYHKTFSGAMQHAYDVAKKKGFTVDPDEIDDKVAVGPKKPSSGKTNRYILGTDKKKKVHIQVANLDGKRYELNMYIEEVELDEGKTARKLDKRDVGMECMECGKKFKVKLSTLQYGKTKCPKCKSTDLDFAYNEEVETDEENILPEGVKKEDAASFISAASKAKQAGKKTFKIGGKEYPVTIKVKIPEEKEEVEIDEKKIKSKKIKGGKIIKKVSSDKKSTKMVGGKEVRMKPSELKKRKIGGKKGARKKKGKMAAIQRKTARSLKKRSSLGMSYVPGGSMIEKWKEAAFDKVRAIRSRLGEGIDAVASRELKLYIEQDRDLYRQQIVPIIKNVQRKMKSGKYDHAQAPKLWLYLVDNGAKKYVKEFGGDFKRDWPKDLRMSIANEFANEYKAEIDIQGGEMI